MEEENRFTGGEQEIEYIPFYGELKMNAEIKKPKKLKTVAVEAVTEAEWVKPIEDYTPTDFALVNDPPEPGVADVSISPAGANVVRRGFTTIQMAQAYRNGLKNKEEYYVVEVREGHGLMVDGPILCHYVVHKGEEL